MNREDLHASFAIYKKKKRKSCQERETDEERIEQEHYIDSLIIILFFRTYPPVFSLSVSRLLFDQSEVVTRTRYSAFFFRSIDCSR